MKKHAFSLLLVGIVIVGLFLSTGAYLTPKQTQEAMNYYYWDDSNLIYVDGERGNDYSANGTELFPYKTITAAIAAAASITDAVTFFVLPETYAESVTVASGDTLISFNATISSVTGNHIKFNDDDITTSGNITTTGTITTTGALDFGGDLTLENDETLGNSTDGWVDIAGKFEIVEASAYTHVAVNVFDAELQSTGTPANGLEATQSFSVETADDNVEAIAVIGGYVADVTDTSEDGELIFKTMTAGAAATEKMRIHDTGEVEFQFGILPDAVTSDPCGSGYPEGAIFYNTTSNYMCYCNGTNDVKMSDDTTACF